MNLTIRINSVDRTNEIRWESFKITDNINEKVNECFFETKKYGAKVWKPVVGNEIEVLDGIVRIFAGTVLEVGDEMDGSKIQQFKAKAVDWTHFLDRQLVVERYNDKTVNQIVAGILTKYAPGFTGNDVNCPIMIKSIAFNHLTISQSLQKMSELVNYSWYVDYNKNIHFFDKNSKLTPFNLTDTNGNYIFESLVLKNDLSQLRNKIKVRGGEIRGSIRTETFDGDGFKKIFVLANKFAILPTVRVGGVARTVGVEYLDRDTDFDCFWNFNEKYIRFKDTTIPPSGTNNIEATGIPLIPIIAQVQDDDSITKYGVFEFYKKDSSIKSLEEAKQHAVAELEAYGKSVVEGGFETYKSGLRSGQLINIQSDFREINESFLVQSVKMSMIGFDKGIWRVELATLRTIGIITFLQRLLLIGQIEIREEENEVIYKFYIDHQTIHITELFRKNPWTAVWVLAPYFPVNDDDPMRPGNLDVSMYLY